MANVAHDRRVIEAPAPPTPRTLRWPALAGLAAAALGLGVAELVAGLLGRTATPVVAVGEAFIDRVPGWLKDLAVDWFGTADKAVLLGGVLVVFAALSAGIGVLTARRRGAGLLAAAGLGLVAALAVWTRPDTTVNDLWPTVLGSGASLIALDRLVDRTAESGATPPRGIARRPERAARVPPRSRCGGRSRGCLGRDRPMARLAPVGCRGVA